jgi:hypothetical protein
MIPKVLCIVKEVSYDCLTKQTAFRVIGKLLPKDKAEALASKKNGEQDLVEGTTIVSYVVLAALVSHRRNQMNQYVSFGDSENDPTYALAEDCFLVNGSESVDENPCVGFEKIPLLPNTADKLKKFAAFMGWAVEYDNDNRLVIYTDIRGRLDPNRIN